MVFVSTTPTQYQVAVVEVHSVPEIAKVKAVAVAAAAVTKFLLSEIKQAVPRNGSLFYFRIELTNSPSMPKPPRNKIGRIGGIREGSSISIPSGTFVANMLSVD